MTEGKTGHISSPCLLIAVFCQEPVLVNICFQSRSRVCFYWCLLSSGHVCECWCLLARGHVCQQLCFLLRGRVYWYLYFLTSKPCNSLASLCSTLSSLHCIRAFLNALTSLSLVCWILWCEEESRERYEVQRAELPALVRRNVWERRQRASETTRHDPTVCTSHHITLPFI